MHSGLKKKIDYFVLNTKLLLINMNIINFFLKKKFKNPIDKNFEFFFTPIDIYGRLIIVNKRVMLMIDLDENYTKKLTKFFTLIDVVEYW